MLKLTVREIKHSLGRYFAILAIMALGVGFFCGLRLTKTAMIHTLDVYVTQNHMFDFRLISTLGFTKEDVDAMADTDGVEAAEGSVSVDVICNTQASENIVLKCMSLPSEVNTLELKSGRLPESPSECVLDSQMSAELLGTVITLSPDNEADALDSFQTQTFTVVGLVKSPLYINFERGSTSVGNGSLAGFFYVLPESLDTEIYTDVYLTVAGVDGEVYSQEYTDAIQTAEDWVATLCETRADLRYQTLYSDARAELDEARQTLDEKQQELEDAKQELEDARQEISDGEQALSDGWAEYNDNASALQQSRQTTNRQLEAARAELEQADAALAEQEQLLTQQQAALDDQAAQFPSQDSVPESVWQELLPQYEQLQAGYAQIEAARQLLEEGKAQAQAGWTEYEASSRQAAAQLNAAEKALAEAKQTLEDAEEELEQGRQELLEAEAEIADGKAQLADAEQDYLDGEAELAKLDYPTCYTLDRSSNVGYVCFESDSDIVRGVSRVFPLFFFLVAALVCITTMTRMVEEQRTQTGVLKALGYSNGAIMSKFLLYAGSASAIGCVAGILAGSYFLPKMIWQAYNIMYGFTDILWAFDWPLAILSSAAYLACAMAATWYACSSELRRPAAELIRPKAPKAGKRILLERIPFVWNRVKFLHKVSIRNILRYKGRMIMMIIGIGGCTALLITGFGIRDSIQNVVNYQYDEITVFDCAVDFLDPMDADAQEEFLQTHDGEISSCLFLSQNRLDCSFGGATKQAYVIVTCGDTTDGFIDLHNSGGAVSYPGENQCILSDGLADALGISVGDALSIRDSDMNELEVTVSGIFENYVYNYVYLSQQTYASETGHAPEFKTAWVNLAQGTDPHESAAALSGDGAVSSISLNTDLQERVSAMMDSLKYIVLLVIICAGALAFIVLYNLTNINITERAREIATVKVLGFYESEASAYVFRENLILTVLGIAAGVPMGIGLHAYVMNQIKIDAIHFDIRIAALSFLISALLTGLFSLIVNLILQIKTRGIDMAQALKSIE